MKKNINITEELKVVEKYIKKDLSKEKTISGLYKYIFRSSGKKMRARLSLIASSVKNHKDRFKLASVIELYYRCKFKSVFVIFNRWSNKT